MPMCAAARIPTIATCVPRGGFAWVTKKLKQDSKIGIPLCTTNRINMPQTAEEILSTGAAVRLPLSPPCHQTNGERPDPRACCLAWLRCWFMCV